MRSRTEKGIEINEMFNLLKKDLELCETIVAHNFLFDKHILLAELFRYNRQDIIELFINKKTYCTMKFSKNLLKIKMKNGGYKSLNLLNYINTFLMKNFKMLIQLMLMLMLVLNVTLS